MCTYVALWSVRITLKLSGKHIFNMAGSFLKLTYRKTATGSSPEMIPEAAWSAYTSGRLQGDFTHRPPDGATELIGYASLCPWRQVFNHRRTDLHPLHLHLLRHDHYSDASEEAGLVSQQ